MKVLVPATIANFGPGFDVFGVGIGEPYDELEVKESSEWEIEVKGFEVPADGSNVAIIAAKALAALTGEELHLKMKLRKGIRPKSGLGSSGASSLAGALAAAKVLGVEDDELIIKAALEGEKAASGSAHGDNVVPAYYGDFTIIESLKPFRVHRIPVDFPLVAVLPEVEVPTCEARKVLPEKIPRKDAVKNVALAGALVRALIANDLKTVGRLLDDRIAFPYRKRLMPWFEGVRKAALDAGAYGAFISGSGPAVFALGEDPGSIGKAIAEAFEDMGIGAEVYVTHAGRGASWF